MCLCIWSESLGAAKKYENMFFTMLNHELIFISSDFIAIELLINAAFWYICQQMLIVFSIESYII